MLFIWIHSSPLCLFASMGICVYSLKHPFFLFLSTSHLENHFPMP